MDSIGKHYCWHETELDFLLKLPPTLAASVTLIKWPKLSESQFSTTFEGLVFFYKVFVAYMVAFVLTVRK